MARYSGKNLYVEFNGTELTADFRSFEVTENITIIDASAGDDAYKDKLTGQKDWTATFNGLATSGATGTALWGAVVPGTEGTLIWAPEGTASGKPKHSGTAIVSERSRTAPYEDVVEISISFEGKSEVTDSTY